MQQYYVQFYSNANNNFILQFVREIVITAKNYKTAHKKAKLAVANNAEYYSYELYIKKT